MSVFNVKKSTCLSILYNILISTYARPYTFFFNQYYTTTNKIGTYLDLLRCHRITLLIINILVRKVLCK